MRYAASHGVVGGQGHRRPAGERRGEEDLNTIGDAAKGGYRKLLEHDIGNEKEPDRPKGLQAYKDFLDKAGDKLERAQTTYDKLQELKHVFLDSYDPSQSIDNMSANGILAKGLFGRMQDKLFGESAPTARSQADDALSVYDAMLKRQKDNDFLQQSRLSRAADIRALAKTERKTVEKLAEDIAAAVLRSRPLSSVTVRKFPLPDAKGVSLTITRARP